METGTVVLKREPIRIPDTPAELLGEVPEANQSLAKRAKQVLDYQPLQQFIEELKLAKHSAEVQIAELFARLGIAPFTPESVAAYQKQELDRVHAREHKGTVMANPFIVPGLVLLALFWGGMGWRSDEIGVKQFYWGCGLITAIAAVFLRGFALKIAEKIGNWEWRSVPIRKYKEPVPEAALEMAIALKRALPQAVIEIESLSRDPFLVFKVEEGRFKRRYHVGVWDEPSFQAEFR